MKKVDAVAKNTAKVNEFMEKLDHPYKAEVQALREIIMNVNEGITEEIKWKAPSFSYKGYMLTVNLWARQRVHLVFHNGAILSNESGLLEGTYPDRRMMYLADMKEVRAKKTALVKIIKEWIAIQDQLAPEAPQESQTLPVAAVAVAEPKVKTAKPKTAKKK